jgi:hypothetical protein
MEHEERVKMGLRIHNPDQLTPPQWAAVTGLARGRSRYEEEYDRIQQQQKDNSHHPAG